MAARRGPRQQPPARPANDEFDPESEWNDEPAANVLKVYLPEFVKNQIRVRFDQVKNTLHVSAERLSGNDRIRVNKEYKIPENSNVREMRAQFEDETLTITIAKEIASKVDPKLPEADKTTQEPSGTQKPADKKTPTPPATPPPPLEKQKSKEKPAKVPSQRPAEGKDLPDPSAQNETTKTKFIKDEDEETQVPPPSSTQKPRGEKVPTPPAVPPPSPKKQKSEEKPAKVPSLPPDPWHEMEEGRDFPDPNVLKGKTKAKFPKDEDENEIQTPPGISTSSADTKKPTEDRKSAKPDHDDKEIASKWKESPRLKDRYAGERKEGKKPEERKEHFSEQEMKMRNDIPGSEELEMKAKEDSAFQGPRGEETDIYAAARQAMLDLTMTIKEDRQLVINMGVAALVIVALWSYISCTMGSSGEGDKN